MDDLEQRVRAFVHAQVPWLPLDMPISTDVVEDARIYGDDVWDLADQFAERFGVLMDGFRWYHHSGPEGCNPLWMLVKPWWARKTYVPIRLIDLVVSARGGEWSVSYPPSEAEPAERSEDRYHTRIGCAVMVSGVVLLAALVVVAGSL